MPTLSEVLSAQGQSGIRNLISVLEKEIARAKISGDISDFVKRLQNIQSVVSPNDLEELKKIDVNKEDIVSKLPELMLKYNEMVYKLQEKAGEVNKELMQYIPNFIIYGDEGLRAMDILTYLGKQKMSELESGVKSYGGMVEGAAKALDIKNTFLTLQHNQMQLKNLTIKSQVPQMYYELIQLPSYKELLQDIISLKDQSSYNTHIKKRMDLIKKVEDDILSMNYPTEVKAEIIEGIHKAATQFNWVSKSASSEDNKLTNNILDLQQKLAGIHGEISALVLGDSEISNLFVDVLPSGEKQVNIPDLFTIGDVLKIENALSRKLEGLKTGTVKGSTPQSTVDAIKTYEEKLKEVRELKKKYNSILEQLKYYQKIIGGK